MSTLADFTLEPDLRTNVVSISKAASSLAALIKRATAGRCPILITQKGYPQGVLISVELYALLCRLTGAQSPADADTGTNQSPPAQ